MNAVARERRIWIDDIGEWDPASDTRELRRLWPMGFVKVSDLVSRECGLPAWDRLTWVVRAEVVGEMAAYRIALRCAERALLSFSGCTSELEIQMCQTLRGTIELVGQWIEANKGDRDLKRGRDELGFWKRAATGGGLEPRAVQMCWCASWLLRLDDRAAVSNVMFLSRTICVGGGDEHGRARTGTERGSMEAECEAQLEIVRGELVNAGMGV